MDTMNDCTIYKTMDIIGKRWSLLILLELYKGSEHFNILKNKLPGITPKILSQRLKELVDDTLVLRVIDKDATPIRTKYSLTDSGKDLVKVINEIKKWGLKWKFKNKDCKTTFCKHCKL